MLRVLLVVACATLGGALPTNYHRRVAKETLAEKLARTDATLERALAKIDELAMKVDEAPDHDVDRASFLDAETENHRAGSFAAAAKKEFEGIRTADDFRAVRAMLRRHGLSNLEKELADAGVVGDDGTLTTLCSPARQSLEDVARRFPCEIQKLPLKSPKMSLKSQIYCQKWPESYQKRQYSYQKRQFQPCDRRGRSKPCETL